MPSEIADQQREIADLGRMLPKKLTALPERFQGLAAPEGTPPGFGVDFWAGSTVAQRVQYVECTVSKRGEPVLVIRTTPEGALVSIHGPGRTKDGRALPVSDDMKPLAAGIERFAESICIREQLIAMRQELKVTLSFQRITRTRTKSRAPLPAIFFASMVSAAQLVWAFDARASGAFTNWSTCKATGDRTATSRITVEECLRKIEGGKRLEWWRDLGDNARADLAMSMLRRAGELLTNPPPWQWWAGTMARSAGWVCRNDFNGWLQVVGVRSWDHTKPSGIRSAIKRFVKPAEQQELF